MYRLITWSTACPSSSTSPHLFVALEFRYPHLRRTPFLLYSDNWEFMLSLNLFLIALPVTHALALPKWHDLSRSSVPMAHPSQTWYHSPDHPVNALFRRASDDDAEIIYAPVGSPGKSIWDKHVPKKGIYFLWDTCRMVGWFSTSRSHTSRSKYDACGMGQRSELRCGSWQNSQYSYV